MVISKTLLLFVFISHFCSCSSSFSCLCSCSPSFSCLCSCSIQGFIYTYIFWPFPEGWGYFCIKWRTNQGRKLIIKKGKVEKKEKGRNRKWRKKGERKKIRIKLDYWYQKGNIIFSFLVYEYLPWNVRKLQQNTFMY